MKTPSPSRGISRTALGLLIVAGLGVAGCRTATKPRHPEVALPAAYQIPSDATNAVSPEELAHWWTVFRDPVLDGLIDEASHANLDVRIARARVLEARALRGVTRSALFPQVGAGGSATRSRVSGNAGSAAQAALAGRGLEGDFYDAAFDVSWEIDVFGGRRRATEAAQADLEATEESGRETRVSVLAEVGLSYLEWRGAQSQRRVAERNLVAQEQTATLTRDRLQAGLASELDVVRAEAQVASTRAQIPPFDETRQRAAHRLGVLLGRAPGEMASRLEGGGEDVPATPVGIPVGLPSDLLRQRPDIRRAERQVAAAAARVGVATAALFPKFYLTGAAGLQSLEAADFLEGGSRFWSLGPSVRWPVFEAGRIRQQIKAEDARHEQALLRYEHVVLASLEEVENALVAFGQEQVRRRALSDSESASRRAVALAQDRYRGGLVDFLDVLEAERAQLAAQDALVRSDRTLGQNLVRLYKAMGGGWVVEIEPEPPVARNPSSNHARNL